MRDQEIELSHDAKLAERKLFALRAFSIVLWIVILELLPILWLIIVSDDIDHMFPNFR